MTRWLLTGGAGYIGTHVTRALLAADIDVVVYDDLSSGIADRVPESVPLVVGDVLDRDLLARTLSDYKIDGVVHFAAKKAVGESVERPLYYYRQNVDGVLSVLEAMQESGVARLVYSSSAAVYGEPEVGIVTERSPTVPTSPYGESKLFGERAIAAYAQSARVADKAVSYALLRYFNVAGAGSDDLGDPSVANLVPLALRAITADQSPRIFGDDYPTPDGTCIRDYVHVMDLATAHVAAVEQCQRSPLGSVHATYNVGRGVGSSVREVLDTVAQVATLAGIEVRDPIVVPRRMGDPSTLMADPARINAELGWYASFGLREIVASALDSWTQT